MKALFRFVFDPSAVTPLTYSPACDPTGVTVESVTFSRDAMPHHHVARAVILDLQPEDFTKAICAVEERIRAQYDKFRRTGWRAASDSITIYFYSWTNEGGRNAA